MKIYVGNLPFSASEDDIRTLFEQGERTVTEVKLITDRATARALGLAVRRTEWAVAVLLGHNYPVFHRFRGGRGQSPLYGGLLAIDWPAVRDAIGPRTRMLMLNSPHNPCGSVVSEGDMRELEALAERHDLLVISDEVYEHLVFDGKRHISVLELPGLRARSFAHFSFGKTFSVTGWKTGYCVAPPALSAELRKVHQFVPFVAVTPVQLALADFMAGEPEFAAGLAAFYQAKREFLLARESKEERPPFPLSPSPRRFECDCGG